MPHVYRCASVKFQCVDPIFVWIQRANECGDLLWEPKSLTHPDNGRELYGAGIEYGLLMRNATVDSHAYASTAADDADADGVAHADDADGHRAAQQLSDRAENIKWDAKAIFE